MVNGDKHMDDAFKKANDEVKFPYHASFWSEVESQLSDDSLDNAFKLAAEKTVVVPQFEMPADLNVDDVFLDEAFKSAGESTSVNYKPEFWQQFQSNLPAIQQDEAFVQAASSVSVDYRPHYWNAADEALQEEGLHYEYKKDYWNEARVLLDKADRRLFFLKWSAVAGILLLLSLAGLYPSQETQHISGVRIANGNQTEMNRHEGEDAQVVTDANSAEHHETSHVVAAHSSNASEVNTNDQGQTVANSSAVSGQSNDNNGQMTNRTGTYNGNGEPVNLLQGGVDIATAGTDISNQPGIVITNSFAPATEPTGVGVSLTTSAASQNELSELVRTPKMPVASWPPAKFDNHNEPGIDLKEVKIEKGGYLTPSHAVAFFGQAGLGNKYGSHDFTPSWRTGFGFTYTNTSFGRLRNFEFGGSLGLNHVRQDDFGTEQRRTHHELSGDFNRYWFKLQIKDMMYASVTANAAWRFAESRHLQHKLKIGFSYDHLVFVQSNMAYQVEADQDITTVNNNWGVKDGLKRSDFKVGFGYELGLGNRFGLNVNGTYGLTDRTDNDFMQNEISDHETSVTIGLNYTFLRK